MIRAIFFDFYSVWTPDKFSFYLANAEINGPEVYKSLYDSLQQYYHGQLSLEQIAETLRVRLGHQDITAETLRLSEDTIAPAIVDFIRSLHGHFLKIGILGNLGNQEYDLLKKYNERNQLFEAIASPLSLQLEEPLFSQVVFSKAIDGIGESSDSCLLVSGNPYYLDFAKTQGMLTLQFEGLAKLQQDIDLMLTQS
jgi:FMN phosphatase YigB (HAD superfamily)